MHNRDYHRHSHCCGRSHYYKRIPSHEHHAAIARDHLGAQVPNLRASIPQHVMLAAHPALVDRWRDHSVVVSIPLVVAVAVGRSEHSLFFFALEVLVREEHSGWKCDQSCYGRWNYTFRSLIGGSWTRVVTWRCRS